MRPDGGGEKTLFFITGLKHQLKQRDTGGGSQDQVEKSNFFTISKLIRAAAVGPFPVQSWSLCSSRWASWHKAGPLSHSLYLCLQTPHWHCWSGPVSARVKQFKKKKKKITLRWFWSTSMRENETPCISRRLPHLHSSLQTRLNDCARALNVDPLKQHAVVAGWGR